MSNNSAYNLEIVYTLQFYQYEAIIGILILHYICVLVGENPKITGQLHTVDRIEGMKWHQKGKRIKMRYY